MGPQTKAFLLYIKFLVENCYLHNRKSEVRTDFFFFSLLKAGDVKIYFYFLIFNSNTSKSLVYLLQMVWI